MQCRHDVAMFEKRGLPSVALLTTEFKHQAQYQAVKLGLERSARVLVQHPVVDPTATLASKADAAFADVLRALTSDDVPIPALDAELLAAAVGDEPDCGT